MAGSGGCNRFAGAVDASAGRLRLGQLASTMMACPAAQMEQEQRFLAMLTGTERLTRDGEYLVLEGPAGTASEPARTHGRARLSRTAIRASPSAGTASTGCRPHRR